MLTLKFIDAKVSVQKTKESQYSGKFFENIFTSYRSAAKSDSRWHFVVNHGGQSIRTRSVELSPLKELHFTTQPRVNLQLQFDESVELWDSDTSDTIEFVLMERQLKDEPPIKRALGTVSMRNFRDTPEQRVEFSLSLASFSETGGGGDEDSGDHVNVTAELNLLTTYSHDVYNQSLMGNMFTCLIPCVTCPPTMPSMENDRPYYRSPTRTRRAGAKTSPSDQRRLQNGIESSESNKFVVNSLAL
mmetsp:Transcript_35189/g.45170  ORF Transcript_35189/g.45170 Transcript_35189/m.45170 type:complete len:245 (-) Transcript_35189:284-1018(-)